jgi:Rieske Fe-S protein
MEPMDSLAFIGRNPADNDTNNNHIYIATGDSGNGITHGTVAGILLSDLILGKNNRWSTLYDPSREVKEEKTNGSSSEDDNNNSSSNKNSKKNDWEKQIAYSIESLDLEQGIIIEEKESKGREEEKKSLLAIYKDEKGTANTFSAICTHLGCTITWNGLEKSFDCPCHGSRFSSTGKVINGPANNNLQKN